MKRMTRRKISFLKRGLLRKKNVPLKNHSSKQRHETMNQKRIFILAITFLAATGSAFSQTLAQARRWFTDKEFEKAKPVFARLVKQSPSNASYNYWYGACCYETGELAEALPYLETSARRKVIDGFLYLSRAYYDLYRFDDAIAQMEDHIYWLKQKKRDTSSADSIMARLRQGARMIRGVEKVTVIDSFTVDKSDFLKTYMLSRESGEITGTEADSMMLTGFVNEFGDRRIEASMTDTGHTRLYSSIKLADGWSKPSPLNGLEENGENPNYPFLAADGITLYYAAQGEESMGGYDIFVTRYNSEDGTYFRPDNIGMPFNSPDNDYMYAIDDFNQLGWFASDRRQPEGKVCVYVFVPNNTKEVYDYETTDPTQLISLAQLDSIALTQTDAAKVRIARQQLAQIMYGGQEKQQQRDFHFIVDDNAVYYTLSDFRSAEARRMFQSLLQKQKDIKTLSDELTRLRSEYSSPSARERVTPAILDKEKRLVQLREETDVLVRDVRNTEIKALKN